LREHWRRGIVRFVIVIPADAIRAGSFLAFACFHLFFPFDHRIDGRHTQ
jgi:restriction endonuclease